MYGKHYKRCFFMLGRGRGRGGKGQVRGREPDEYSHLPSNVRRRLEAEAWLELSISDPSLQSSPLSSDLSDSEPKAKLKPKPLLKSKPKSKPKAIPKAMPKPKPGNRAGRRRRPSNVPVIRAPSVAEDYVYTDDASDDFAVLGKGSFGCVVQPAPTCVSTDRRFIRNRVAKYQAGKTADIELAAQRYIKEVDPDSAFTITAESSCAADQRSPMVARVIADCDLDDTKTKDLKAMVFPHGGITIGRFVTAPASPYSMTLDQIQVVQPAYELVLLEVIIQAFQALALLHAKAATFGTDVAKKVRYVHMDLNLNNVLVKAWQGGDSGPDIKILCRLIDFGASTIRLKQVIEGNEILPWDYHPPDYSVVRAVVRGRDSVTRDSLVLWSMPTQFDKVKLEAFREGYVGSLLQYIHDEDRRYADFNKAVHGLLEQVNEEASGDVRAAIRLFPWEKVDIYQMGFNAAFVFVVAMAYSDTGPPSSFRVINDVFEVLLRCVNWCYLERPSAQEVVHALTTIRQKHAIKQPRRR